VTQAPVGDLGARLAFVREQVADAARSVGRNPEAITVIAVTKFHPASLVRELAALGVADVGENRAQEAAAKVVEVGDASLRWHFIGRLQRNKARLVRGFATAVHSVDSVSLADALGGEGPVLDCFVQLDLTDDRSRGGVSSDALLPLAEHVLGVPGLRLRGVMAIAPLGEDPRRAFSRLRAASESVRALDASACAISAGMSGDFAAAIAEGATHLRLGTAITGMRPVRA
jgi:pyridoxal phosphate enzyme (YggS family)